LYVLRHASALEALASEAGVDLIDEAFFDDAKAKFGQK